MEQDRMKIVMFGHKRIPSREGGVEVAVGELSRRMAAMGHEVVCYNRGGVGTANRICPGVSVKTAWTLNGKGLAAVTASFFAAVCGSFGKAEVVHIHGEGPAFMCWLPKLLGKRVVVTVHGLDWQRAKWQRGPGARFIRWGERMAVRFADRIIVLSQNMQAYFLNTYGRETVWIPNGVSRPEPVPMDAIGCRFGLEKDGYLLFVGRLVPEKGIHYLIEAFRSVRTDKKLVIAGAPSDTESYEKQLKAQASGDKRILFAGFQQGRILEELYSNAYVYVLPSDVEGMPLSLLEAMSYGNCCLVSDIPECTEVVEERGVAFPRGDVSALRDRLQTLCDRPELVAACREKARTFLSGKYSWDEVAEKTLELYR